MLTTNFYGTDVCGQKEGKEVIGKSTWSHDVTKGSLLSAHFCPLEGGGVKNGVRFGLRG